MRAQILNTKKNKNIIIITNQLKPELSMSVVVILIVKKTGIALISNTTASFIYLDKFSFFIQKLLFPIQYAYSSNCLSKR